MIKDKKIYFKIIAIVIFLLLVIGTFAIAVSAASSSAAAAAAGAAAAGAAAANAERQRIESASGSGCIPPTSFADRYDCRLEYTRYVNEYDCGSFVVKADCNGNVLSYKDYTEEYQYLLWVIMGIILIAFVTWVITFTVNNILERKSRRERHDTYY